MAGIWFVRCNNILYNKYKSAAVWGYMKISARSVKIFLCSNTVITNKESRQGVCPACFLLYRSYIGDRFYIHALFRDRHYFSAFAAESVNFCKSDAILGENDVFRDFNLPRSQNPFQAMTDKR